MSDDLKLLLGEWKDLSAAATRGPWAYHSFGRGGDPEPTTIAIHTGDFDWDDLASEDSETAVAWMPGADSLQLYDDAAFIALSRTLVPRFIAALEAVLDEHHAETLYRYLGEDVCPQHGDNQLEEIVHGEWACMGCPSDDGPVCATCVDEHGEALLYPCPTVTAIHAVLIGDNDD